MHNSVKNILAALLVMSSLGASAVATTAQAALIVDKKIAQFGLEPRVKCVKWASGKWPWGGGWKTCIGHKTEFLQHKFHLVVDGPNPEAAARRLLEEAAAVAVSAAVGTGIATPSPEPAARIAAAVTAAKTAFVGYLGARGAERLISQYSLKIKHLTSWS